ncbi:MAG: iron-sulfur cluster assembly scaffold protein [Helicobacteraceae bacterium]|jgi:NifU-like protein|nr:iron-sulfur cluster assembly scaffold protein [Helicobacteraceae bacterium]
MAKENLIGGALWEEYSHKVSERMDNPKNRGEITEDEAKSLGCELVVADFGAESCGDAVRLFWAVDPATNVIKLARFKSFGCGTAIASSDIMAELCVGKKVDEAVKITNIDVEFALRDTPDQPAVPPQKMHCSVMAYDVIKRAAAIYNGVDMSAYEDEDIVCECARVTLSAIKEVIRLNRLKSVEEITAYTKAGAFCKSCVRPGGHERRHFYLADILRDTLAEMERERILDSAAAQDFAAMSLVNKIKRVEAILDADIRPMLVVDGGNMELLEIKDSGENIDIYIRYLGACSGCAAGSTGTLYAIESVLREKLSSNIRVLPV